MNAAKYTVWSNRNLDLDEYRKDIIEMAKENGEPIPSDDELYERMVEDNALLLDDERTNLDIDLGAPIIVIADIGRWNGRVNAYKIIESGNIKDCLVSDTDYAEWYVDVYGNLRCDAVHHDGTNHYLYRVIKPELSERCREHLFDCALRGVATPTLLTRYTKAVGVHIAEVYGWKVRGAKVAC